MPWVDKEKCTGCEICVDKCPVGAISMAGDNDAVAVIDMDGCVHCGTCHSVCPQQAVRHDGEKIPQDVKVNIEETKKFMELCAKHLGSEQEKNKCLGRMIKHWNKEKVVAEQTLAELEKMKDSGLL
ncbi:MAG: 4Fe-4S binding protein [Candidatus Omnitrophica bacterium]|nr:4Fe-4S binding protein [Candidatus Omnitrophota bacterium]